jgi:GAF domain-containing protein
VSKGLVGRTVRTNSSVLEPNVHLVSEWLPNPLLPHTQAEATVPISLGNEILGVLDIQQNQINGLNESDVDLLESISGQVAVALQNARLIANAQEKARQEVLINEIGQQIQNATTIERAMQVAVREIGRAVQAKETRVRLGTRPLSPIQNGSAITEITEEQEEV